MHTTCAALQRHMIAHNDIGRAVDKRMLRHHIFELAALEGSQHFVVAFPARGQRLFKKALRHDIVFLAAADHMIGEIRAETNRHIAGQRPGRGLSLIHILANVAGVLILAGGIGNMIDRLAYGYVVDFLYVKLINFPIFNFADCCVVIGAALLLVAFLFVYKDEKIQPVKADALSAGEDGASQPQEDGEQHEDRRDDGSAGDGGEPA